MISILSISLSVKLLSLSLLLLLFDIKSFYNLLLIIISKHINEYKYDLIYLIILLIFLISIYDEYLNCNII